MKKLILLSLLFIGCISSPSDITVDSEVEDMYFRYNKAWSDADFETITNEIYSVPFSLYLQDSTIVFNNSYEVNSFVFLDEQ